MIPFLVILKYGFHNVLDRRITSREVKSLEVIYS